MNKRNVVILLILAALGVAVFLNRDRIHFDWGTFVLQVKSIRLGLFAAALALNFLTFFIRALRWSVFLAPTKKVPASRLIGSQFIGFTAVALFGRLADLTRPFLIAKRVDLPLSSQIAVYTIERMFDLGAAAIIFSGAMAVTPNGLPHHDLFVRVGIGSLIVTVAIALFAVAVRVAGGTMAAMARGTIGKLSKPAGESFSSKILGFRDGLNTLASFREFLLVSVLSLAIWCMVGLAYYATVHAFVQTPELSDLTFSRVMLLLAASIGGSLITLPVIGWFTQIAALAAAMQAFYGAPLEAATACGALLLIVGTLGIVPIGLLFAQIEQVSLKPAAERSADAEIATVTK